MVVTSPNKVCLDARMHVMRRRLIEEVEVHGLLRRKAQMERERQREREEDEDALSTSGMRYGMVLMA